MIAGVSERVFIVGSGRWSQKGLVRVAEEEQKVEPPAVDATEAGGEVKAVSVPGMDFEALRDLVAACVVHEDMVKLEPGSALELINLAERYVEHERGYKRSSRLSVDAERVFQQLRTKLHNQEQTILRLERENQRLQRAWGQRIARLILEEDPSSEVTSQDAEVQSP